MRLTDAHIALLRRLQADPRILSVHSLSTCDELEQAGYITVSALVLEGLAVQITATGREALLQASLPFVSVPKRVSSLGARSPTASGALVATAVFLAILVTFKLLSLSGDRLTPTPVASLGNADRLVAE
jgi:hypothetical protein